MNPETREPIFVILFMLIGFLIGVIMLYVYSLSHHSERKIVENTPACFYLDDDYKRQFSWECDDE